MDLTHGTTCPAASLPRPRTGGPAFLREAVLARRTTGAIAPSGGPPAARLAAPLVPPGRGRPRRVLEVGAGTGTVTRALARRLGPADRLDAVELNPRFVRVLTGLLDTDPVLSAASGRVRVVPGSITDLPPAPHGYDVIVSCLPFTNFEPEVVRSVLERYMAALVPGGHLTCFACLGTRALRTAFGGRAEAARHRAAVAVLDGFGHRYGHGRGTVWRNLPPARVHHLWAPDRVRHAGPGPSPSADQRRMARRSERGSE
ncbi:class I SAM-dependent methyltransferase [Streptomyces sp. AV19]|uniref:class I SAM-dependent methyltransferase n=1 Tax=Streptomyces sp. AV19 TaxID=2793068 RepID=UPI0018FE79B2|nr:class I SAM-dependent methyltransferase [Streptomyces sp. AV19]MBH1933831.1 class I SAM-dependent methyltransferase [Streptomyces sp. AV19]MDG4535664.1 class I SAM-dependent methyltransferase [Streptomyces sp. AV19]